MNKFPDHDEFKSSRKSLLTITLVLFALKTLPVTAEAQIFNGTINLDQDRLVIITKLIGIYLFIVFALQIPSRVQESASQDLKATLDGNPLEEIEQRLTSYWDDPNHKTELEKNKLKKSDVIRSIRGLKATARRGARAQHLKLLIFDILFPILFFTAVFGYTPFLESLIFY